MEKTERNFIMEKLYISQVYGNIQTVFLFCICLSESPQTKDENEGTDVAV